MRKGSRMSISIPDKKMDDYARDCVVRLANRVDDWKLRERLLHHRRIGGAPTAHRIQASEVNVRVIERIVTWRTGRDAASFSILWQGKNVKIREVSGCE